MTTGKPKVSPRERAVAARVALGWRNRQIGEALNITERTVKKHVANACRKFGVSSRLELALKVRSRRGRRP